MEDWSRAMTLKELDQSSKSDLSGELRTNFHWSCFDVCFFGCLFNGRVGILGLFMDFWNGYIRRSCDEAHARVQPRAVFHAAELCCFVMNVKDFSMKPQKPPKNFYKKHLVRNILNFCFLFSSQRFRKGPQPRAGRNPLAPPHFTIPPACGSLIFPSNAAKAGQVMICSLARENVMNSLFSPSSPQWVYSMLFLSSLKPCLCTHVVCCRS